uniref:G-protein coupled receptors family 1 profile domain-containing protein n=1 Tax=Capitella teleta TaxID=283909 RepID=X2ALK6_CAPTE
MENSTVWASTEESDSEVDYTKPWYNTLLIWNAISALLVVATNLLPLIAYVRTKELQTPTNRLICNQSLSDVLSALASQPFAWIGYSQSGIMASKVNKWVCLWGIFSIRVSQLAALVGVLLLTLERSVAIFSPFNYYVFITDKVVRWMIGCAWMFAVVVTILPLLNWNLWSPGMRCFTVYVFPRIYNVFIYVSFFLVFTTCAILMVGIAVVAIKKNRVDDSNSAARIGHIKVMKMLMKVVGIFFLTRVPYTAMTFVWLSVPSGEREQMPNWFLEWHDYTKVLMYGNSICNPLIYAHSNSQFRNAFKRILRLQ